MKSVSPPLDILPLALVFLVAASLIGCTSFGASTVERDRSGYTDALTESMKTQMLLNIVKMRYGDMPLFLDVKSIINSYTLETEIEAGAGFTFGGSNVDGTLGAKGLYSDRPTITYAPLVGEAYAEVVMRPLPPNFVFQLIQAGASVEYMFGISVKSINGINNRAAHATQVTPVDPAFLRLIDLLEEIQDAGGLDFQITGAEGNTDAVTLVVNRFGSSRNADKIDALLNILGAPDWGNEFRLIYGRLPKQLGDVAVLTRSIYGVLQDISLEVDIPPEDIEAGAATAGIPLTSRAAGWRLLQIRSGNTQPKTAAVAVKYRGHWFWIDETDIRSKQVFTSILILFNMAGTEKALLAPVITVPAG